VHGFACVIGFVVAGDVGELDALLLEALLVAHFSLHVDADHHLVDYHADDGAKERGENRHQEPAVSSPGEGQKIRFDFVSRARIASPHIEMNNGCRKQFKISALT